jgi:hypothetical protein
MRTLAIPETYDTYLSAASSGRLTARVTGALWWDRDLGLDQLDLLLGRRSVGDRAVRDCLDAVAAGIAESEDTRRLGRLGGSARRRSPLALLSARRPWATRRGLSAVRLAALCPCCQGWNR